ncbi:MAG: hypothetical protein JWL75_211 [Parcubacteria group bacterium]|nr:hypothetical protein [Parcubacteria group bacterium]
MKYLYALFAALFLAGYYVNAPLLALAGFAFALFIVVGAHIIAYNFNRRNQDHRSLIMDIRHIFNEDRRAGGIGRMTLLELAIKLRDLRYVQANGNDTTHDRSKYMPKLRHVKKALDALAAQDDRLVKFDQYPPRSDTYGFLSA